MIDLWTIILALVFIAVLSGNLGRLIPPSTPQVQSAFMLFGYVFAALAAAWGVRRLLG